MRVKGHKLRIAVTETFGEGVDAPTPAEPAFEIQAYYESLEDALRAAKAADKASEAPR